MEKTELRDCPDCGVKPGRPHMNGCDVERCSHCGGQRISCGCRGEKKRLVWTGRWPGHEECERLGLYAKFIRGEGWVKCDKDDPEGCPDLNTLAEKGIWSEAEGKYTGLRD